MVLCIICVMIILNPKQFCGSSVNDLQNSTRYLHDGNRCCFRPWLYFNFLHLSYTHPQSYCFIHLLVLVPEFALQNEFITQNPIR